MYNLTVDEAHTFFVGDGQWLVHNAGLCDLVRYDETFASSQATGRSYLSTDSILWSQREVSSRFSQGPWKDKTLKEVATGLGNGSLSLDNPLLIFIKKPKMNQWPITTYTSAWTGDVYRGYWERLANGCIYCINNRGLTVSVMAGLDNVPVQWATNQEVIKFSYQYTADLYGNRIWLRDYQEWLWKDYGLY